MKKILPYIAIIGIGAFTGNMINIGLSYGIHWLSLEPVDFMATFAIDFPLLLGSTIATLLPAFIATVGMYFLSDKGSKARRYWLFAVVGLLIIDIQTIIYHLPVNLAFMGQNVEPALVGGRLNTWLVFHWVRIVVAVAVGVYALRAFESSLKSDT